MNGELQAISDATEMSIDQTIAATTPLFVAAEQTKLANLDNLYEFQKVGDETMDEFTARMLSDFDDHLESGAWDLMDTGVTIPDIPDFADSDAEDDAREA